MNKIIVRIIFIIFLILNYVMIFYFSAQSGVESSEVSESVLRKILYNFKIIGDLEKVSNLELIIRKLAHFSLYFFAEVWLMFVIFTFNNRLKYTKYISILINTMYAILDEIHQTFVPGREGKLYDVCIDLSGILCAFFFISIINILYNKKRGKIKDNCRKGV